MEPLRWKRESAAGLCGALLMLGVVNAINSLALLVLSSLLDEYTLFDRVSSTIDSYDITSTMSCMPSMVSRY
jgi:hypothetical protein